MLRLLFSLLICLFCFPIMKAQNTVSKKSDSLYDKINNFSQKKNFFKIMHKLIFRKIEKKLKQKKKSQKTIKLIQVSNKKYNCKWIRNITIETLDPFGYSNENEKLLPTSKIENIGNSLHFKTKVSTIRNLLLFKVNEELDSIKVKESERIIRSQRYLNSVIIKAKPIPNNLDSVDVYVRVLDTWSTIPTGAISTSKANLDLTERNFFGLGHEFELNYIKSFDNSSINSFGYESKYSITNFKHTFINASFYSKCDLYNNTNKSIKFERPFFSTLSHWAGGISYDFSSNVQFITDAENTTSLQSIRKNYYSIWGASAIEINNKKSEFWKYSQLVFAIGYTNIDYIPNFYYGSSRSFLSTIGISNQKYYQDKYLFRFGIVEDIPHGKVFSITGGAEKINNITRAYLGGRFSYGKYFDLGYLQANIEVGSFLYKKNSMQTTYKFEANYFTKLLSIGKWKFRQFVKPILILGVNRLNSSNDRLNLNNTNGIPGFNDTSLTGVNKLLSTFQTQAYNQKNWYGFNFSPFINFTVGFLDNGNLPFFGNKIYNQIGIGVLVNNRYLVFDSFQLSFSFYPSFPLNENNVFKTNAFQNSNIEFKDFRINQPSFISYQ